MYPFKKIKNTGYQNRRKYKRKAKSFDLKKIEKSRAEVLVVWCEGEDYNYKQKDPESDPNNNHP